jgi:hypothetical protein
MEPQLYEDASTGGADFECTYNGLRFAVEATRLSEEIVTNDRGWRSTPALELSISSPRSACSRTV